MDKDTLKQALDEMRGELRSRVGKKLLSIEVHSHTDEPSKEEEEETEEPSVETERQKTIGMPLF